MCPIISWFGPLERQLKECLFEGHLVAKRLFGKGPTITFLDDCTAADFSAVNLILLFDLYSAMRHTQPVTQHVMIVLKFQEIMKSCCANHIDVI
jgi:hypothetical protein